MFDLERINALVRTKVKVVISTVIHNAPIQDTISQGFIGSLFQTYLVPSMRRLTGESTKGGPKVVLSSTGPAPLVNL